MNACYVHRTTFHLIFDDNNCSYLILWNNFKFNEMFNVVYDALVLINDVKMSLKRFFHLFFVIIYISNDIAWKHI